jgi:hypothetical protein
MHAMGSPPARCLLDIVLGEARPTCLEPFLVEGGPHDKCALIDGGVPSNNPANCAYAEPRTIHPEQNGFLVVSLGTGELTRSLPYEEVRGWGLVLWAQPLLNVVFDGVADTVDYQLREFLSTEEGKPPLLPLPDRARHRQGRLGRCQPHQHRRPEGEGQGDHRQERKCLERLVRPTGRIMG